MRYPQAWVGKVADLTGQLIADRYLVKAFIASGGMASVYRAQDTVLERVVALKVIHPHLATDKSFVEKFRREAKTAASLSHPNLVNVFDQGTDNQATFLVMEYVPGINLRDALNDYGLLSPKRALEILEPLTAGLAAAHAAGILHRDLKPENVFLSDSGIVKLGDFGLAREITSHTQTGSLVGTAAYLSPELVLRGQADARSDIYSLGVMAFEMLTGKQPYDGDQAVQIAYQHANSNIPAPSSLNPEVPELLDEIVLWATARNPSDRPSSAKELLPVITRAKSDIKRGLTTTFEDFGITRNFTEEFVAPAGATEVIGEMQPAESSERADSFVKLAKANRRSGRLVLIVTLLAIFFSAGSGWWFSTGPGGASVVPELEGRSVEVAISTLEPIGLQVTQEQEHSAVVPVGRVTRTEPIAGTRVAKQSPITVFVSLGPKQVLVPEPLGLNLEQAKQLLIDTGLTPGAVDSFFDVAEVGQVFAFSQAAGTSLDEGSVVDLQVSLGPVPAVEGLSLQQATEKLQAVGLTVSSQQVFSDQVPAGQVVSLTPSAEPLPEAGSVSLEVSKGPEFVTMPNVVGETVLAARNALQALGLTVEIDTDQLSSRYGIVKVTKQTPTASTRVRVGSEVTISTR
ncbi:MAG: Stk1 family PASTA domain-containing Ser/Thr kinase [Actinobacteria bacterium]|nr:Stk1 family PASTA domain-containing Ser/Thr kinase [Actinomycetota bacterium]